MFLFKLPHLLPLLPFLHDALAIASPAPAGPSTNTTATTTTNNDPNTPQPPTPNFSLGAKVPFQGQDPFSLLTMLFLTCEGLFTFAPYAYTSSSPSAIKISGTLKIQVDGSPELPASAFQIRHAMWALWIGAVTQLDDRDYRPGIFVMDVKGSTGVKRSVGSIVYRNDNREPTTTMVAGVGSGDATVDAGEGGVVGAIEPVVAGAGAGTAGMDVTSRRRSRGRMLRRGVGGQEDGFDAIMKNRQWTVPAAPTTTNVSFPGFPPASSSSNSTTTSTTRTFYNIQITGTSPYRISLTEVFTTVYETMVERCSLPDREDLFAEWIYISERSKYVFGIRPPGGMPVGESPPFEAMMGAMSNLPRALQSGRYKVEVTFDVLDGETGAVVLQGFLALDK